MEVEMKLLSKILIIFVFYSLRYMVALVNKQIYFMKK